MAGKPRNPRPNSLSGKIGERIETLRKRQGWTSQELADRSGLGLNTIVRIERGEGSPTIRTLEAITETLRITLTEFLTELNR